MGALLKGAEVAYRITKAEHDALYGLPFLQQLLYFRAIRPYMDFASGLVGIERGISYQSLAEECFVAPHPGYAVTRVGRDQVRRGVVGLEQKKIIQRRSEGRCLIIQCLLATQDSCVQNKAATRPPQQAARVKGSAKAALSGGYDVASPQGTLAPLAKAAIPLVSGNTLSLIDADFQPSKKILQLAEKHGCPTTRCSDELCRFITYHQSKGTRSCDWQAEYFHWLLKAKHYFAKGSTNAGDKTKPSPRRHESAVDKVLRAHQKWFR